jgi:hypothetical protein
MRAWAVAVADSGGRLGLVCGGGIGLEAEEVLIWERRWRRPVGGWGKEDGGEAGVEKKKTPTGRRTCLGRKETARVFFFCFPLWLFGFLKWGRAFPLSGLVPEYFCSKTTI